ncbi:caffeoylshikimate esterase-like isoform X3 [Musa acuminata AAA Group]|uniref:caffeoylshikimate esterase-like isoform X3 n=1 Tax=Musa acuminata AAA Group TaxID=214697 RepID=UPI0031D5655D
MAIYTAAITRHRPIQLQPLDRVWGTPTGRPLRRAAVVAVAKKAIEGVGDELNAVAAENMDFAPARRRVRYAFADVHRRLDHFLFKIAPTGIQMEERYEMNSKGVEVFWKSWLPKPGTTTKAALFFCHGYGSTCTFFFEGIAKIIADAGYAVFAMDYPGFGLSQGLHGYIPSFDGMVDHVIEQYAAIRAMEGVRELRHFLLGQSMGGAVALKIHLKQPEEWDGVLLVAPMCKIAEEVTPPGPVLKALTLMSYVLPEAKLFPQKDLGVLSFRDPTKRKVAELNVISYSDQMRLRTAVELIKATQDIESQLKKVRSPLLILHGAADKVTDPNVSKILYNMANTNDKTLKLYEEGFHCILEGEPDGRILSVINDIISWLDSHSDKN